MGKIDARLAELGISLPEVVRPVGAYVPAVRSGSYVYVSGQLPLVGGKLVFVGKVGAEVTPEQGKEAARVSGINALAALASVVGSLDKVKRIVKVTGFVASAPGFTAQPGVVNGASDLFKDVFGETGQHARSAIGVAELPLGVPVEVELIAEVE
jgi:enamine deaminase RidA (YjgF/YER057c/UK114 family)